MNKVELEAKVDALMDEINFLRAFYEAVRPWYPGWRAGGREHWGRGTQTVISFLASSLLPLPPNHLWIAILEADLDL